MLNFIMALCWPPKDEKKDTIMEFGKPICNPLGPMFQHLLALASTDRVPCIGFFWVVGIVHKNGGFKLVGSSGTSFSDRRGSHNQKEVIFEICSVFMSSHTRAT
jgi:hypothetical protein